MPQACAAFRCRNRRSLENRHQLILTCFCQRFPKDPGLRKAWAIAVRRKDFKPNDTTVLCSCHFKADDFDRTGQIVRLRESVIPSVFASFPDHLNKVSV
uniref:THAP-type domain-containing protein n=1 Tax=Paramormyrops kingsleyae TaxID=1676925 RepID=A0A3B3RD22_9TELE